MLTGHTANLPNDTMLDSGVFYVGSNPIGVSRGGFKFDPGWDVVNSEFDGKHAPILGLDRKFYGESVISGTLIEFGPATHGNQIAKMEAGIAGVDTGVTPNTLTTLTPAVGGVPYPAGSYLNDVRLVFERAIATGAGVKKYVAIYYPKAIVRKWGPIAGANKDHPTIEFEVAARKDMSAGTTADAPYKIELREALP